MIEDFYDESGKPLPTQMEKNNSFGYACFPDCPYFPSSTNANGTIDYTYQNDYKVREDKSFRFCCLYDGHAIKDWMAPDCPIHRGG